MTRPSQDLNASCLTDLVCSVPLLGAPFPHLYHEGLRSESELGHTVESRPEPGVGETLLGSWLWRLEPCGQGRVGDLSSPRSLPFREVWALPETVQSWREQVSGPGGAVHCHHLQLVFSAVPVSCHTGPCCPCNSSGAPGLLSLPSELVPFPLQQLQQSIQRPPLCLLGLLGAGSWLCLGQRGSWYRAS